MKTILSLALFSVLAIGFPVSAREFTDSKGRKIEAELVAHSGSNIVINRSGKEFSVPVAMFSIDDQQFIKNWIEENPNAVRFKFGYYSDLKRQGISSHGKAPGGMIDDRLKVVPYTYEMILYNKDVAPISDIEVRYEIYVADYVDTNRNAFTKLAVGAEKVGKIQVIAGSFQVTDPIQPKGRVEFHRTFDTESYIDRDGGRTDAFANDKVIGVRIRVYKGEKMLSEYEEDEDSNWMKKTSWSDAKASKGTVLK